MSAQLSPCASASGYCYSRVACNARGHCREQRPLGAGTPETSTHVEGRPQASWLSGDEEPSAAPPPRNADGALLCSYCNAPAVFHASSAAVYGGRDYGPVWACTPCQAWVGCHGTTDKPLGRLANKALRQAKMAAHAAFDPIWQAKQRRDGLIKGHARGKGYKWLAAQLGIEPAHCHVGMMNEGMCRRVVEVCQPFRRAHAAARRPSNSPQEGASA